MAEIIVPLCNLSNTNIVFVHDPFFTGIYIRNRKYSEKVTEMIKATEWEQEPLVWKIGRVEVNVIWNTSNTKKSEKAVAIHFPPPSPHVVHKIKLLEWKM